HPPRPRAHARGAGEARRLSPSAPARGRDQLRGEAMSEPKKTKTEPFEKSLESLEKLVRELESGDKGLDESLALYEKGVALARELTGRLEEAKTKVEALSKGEGGKLVKRPFAAQD